jgi:diadenosine tetraphosphatase ApaH/serine/threonine PP2A family protein phosphatase
MRAMSAGGPKAIISDVHGNLEALMAVLGDIAAQEIADIICLGDVVGYGPNPVECADVVRERCRVVLCGNHDAAATGLAFGFNRPAREAIDWTRRQLKPGVFSLPPTRARWEFLKTLPHRFEEDGVLFVHGSPRDPVMEYIEESDTVDLGFGPSDKILRIFEALPGPCFVGHTHRPGVITSEMKWVNVSALPEGRFTVEPAKKAIVNVGSVGQPRDEDRRACYVVLDGPTATYRRVEYDYNRTREKMLAVQELDPRLGDRLGEGR